ncbi:ABC transporter permease DevC [Synechococcus sp. PCC 6312]|uniref:ABC transporter permease DevC n=1 Tax=Synechococcus sp. (strain ATCC 27167 / PCC 6312) TaxID=195253 RepID=UPI00029EF0E6|nr:ABC transporter permease DevC [Synechococcus sp. PCC 6312]AFY60711.1 DevC protein [Synechococcus sp. PCC 6312]
MLRKFWKKTPLAWLQLTRQKSRFFVALAGIAFADMLIFIQMGFEGALMDAAVKPHMALNADLVLVNPQLQTLFSVQSFAREHLYQALAIEDVKSVSPLYFSTGQWRNPETRLSRNILVWGIDPAQSPFKLPDVNANLDRIKPLGQVIYDQAGRPEFGNIAALYQTGDPLETEIGTKRIQVAGLFTMGASFAADGNVIASDSTFLHLFNRNPEQIEVGLIHLRPGADLLEVQKELRQHLPSNINVLTIEEFAKIERTYWAEGTGIGFIFGLGVIMGFIVGIVIVYQILYSDVSDHLPEYATLKAMGYGDNYLLGVLMQEALILAVLGFIPSLALATGLYQLTYAATMLPIFMKTERAVNVFVLTVVMCFISGAIAMRKLQAADPADIF